MHRSKYANDPIEMDPDIWRRTGTTATIDNTLAHAIQKINPGPGKPRVPSGTTNERKNSLYMFISWPTDERKMHYWYGTPASGCWRAPPTWGAPRIRRLRRGVLPRRPRIPRGRPCRRPTRQGPRASCASICVALHVSVWPLAFFLLSSSPL
jgi:hypothetical protein